MKPKDYTDREKWPDEIWYFTFGQTHTHSINGETFDKDTVLAIKGNFEQARQKMIELCGKKWGNQYYPQQLDLRYFPRGVHYVD